MAVQAKKETIDIRTLIVTSKEPGGEFFVSLWFYDVTCAVRFDTMKLPLASFRYMVEGLIDTLTNSRRKVRAKIGLFGSIFTLDLWDLTLYCGDSIWYDILVDVEYLTLYPQLAV